MDIGKYRMIVAALSLALIAGVVSNAPAHATVMTFTSSTAFNAAAGALAVENYSSGVAGETIASGGSFHGLTYNFTAGPSGTLLGGIITNQFNSFSGLSLGGNQSGGAQFFFGGDSFTITFPTPITGLGVFFNVNLNSGNYDLDTPVGDATTGSAVYDTSTFVFDGLISTTPFSTATFASTNMALGSFNVPEVEFSSVPEPGSLALLGTALAGFGLIRRRRRSV